MGNTWAVCKREFKSYFLTPVGYVVSGIVAVISGLAFTASFSMYAQTSQSPAEYAYPSVPDFEEVLLSPFLVFCGLLVMFLSPLITMRLLAEERHRGTIELLLTQPLRDREIIFGKYLAAMGMVLVLMLSFLIQLGIVHYFVEVETVVLAFGLLTVLLMGASFISLGLFISAVTRNQITAGTLTFGICFIFFILGKRAEDLPREIPNLAEKIEQLFGKAPDFVLAAVAKGYEIFRGLALELAIDAHAADMAQGILQPKDIAYYVLFSAFFLFLTFRAFESRNWRG